MSTTARTLEPNQIGLQDSPSTNHQLTLTTNLHTAVPDMFLVGMLRVGLMIQIEG